MANEPPTCNMLAVSGPSKRAPTMETFPAILAPDRNIPFLNLVLFCCWEPINKLPPTSKAAAFSTSSKLAPGIKSCPLTFAPFRFTTFINVALFKSTCPAIRALSRLTGFLKTAPLFRFKSLSECRLSAKSSPLISELPSSIRLSVRMPRQIYFAFNATAVDLNSPNEAGIREIKSTNNPGTFNADASRGRRLPPRGLASTNPAESGRRVCGSRPASADPSHPWDRVWACDSER